MKENMWVYCILQLLSSTWRKLKFPVKRNQDSAVHISRQMTNLEVKWLQQRGTSRQREYDTVLNSCHHEKQYTPRSSNLPKQSPWNYPGSLAGCKWGDNSERGTLKVMLLPKIVPVIKAIHFPITHPPRPDTPLTQLNQLLCGWSEITETDVLFLDYLEHMQRETCLRSHYWWLDLQRKQSYTRYYEVTLTDCSKTLEWWESLNLTFLHTHTYRVWQDITVIQLYI